MNENNLEEKLNNLEKRITNLEKKQRRREITERLRLILAILIFGVCIIMIYYYFNNLLNMINIS
jgi:uncharacterized membrane protein YvbJ